MGRVIGSVRGSLAKACGRCWRFPPDRWGPLAVTGGNLVVECAEESPGAGGILELM